MSNKKDLIDQLVLEMESFQSEFFKDGSIIKIVDGESNVSSSAYVGMFWFLEGELLIINDKTLVSEIKVGKSIKQYPIDHFKVWSLYMDKFPKLKEYQKIADKK